MTIRGEGTLPRSVYLPALEGAVNRHSNCQASASIQQASACTSKPIRRSECSIATRQSPSLAEHC